MNLVGFTKEIKNILSFFTNRKKAVYEDHLRLYSPPSLCSSIRPCTRPPVRRSVCLSVCLCTIINS